MWKVSSLEYIYILPHSTTISHDMQWCARDIDRLHDMQPIMSGQCVMTADMKSQHFVNLGIYNFTNLINYNTFRVIWIEMILVILLSPTTTHTMQVNNNIFGNEMIQTIIRFIWTIHCLRYVNLRL